MKKIILFLLLVATSANGQSQLDLVRLESDINDRMTYVDDQILWGCDGYPETYAEVKKNKWQGDCSAYAIVFATEVKAKWPSAKIFLQVMWPKDWLGDGHMVVIVNGYMFFKNDECVNKGIYWPYSVYVKLAAAHDIHIIDRNWNKLIGPYPGKPKQHN